MGTISGRTPPSILAGPNSYLNSFSASSSNLNHVTTYGGRLEGGNFSRSSDPPLDPSLTDLRLQDWARLWMQLIHELRRGVQLKKVTSLLDLSSPHLNSYHIRGVGSGDGYEMTPYEMLLDDIRSKKYRLKTVMVNGDIPPRVKQDAHELILDFIRSRPPLKPASRRVVPPLKPATPTPYEKLMNSIRSKDSEVKLRQRSPPPCDRHYIQSLRNPSYESHESCDTGPRRSSDPSVPSMQYSPHSSLSTHLQSSSTSSSARCDSQSKGELLVFLFNEIFHITILHTFRVRE